MYFCFKKNRAEMTGSRHYPLFPPAAWCCLLFSLALSLVPAFADGVSFSGLDLSDDNRLLFRAGSGSQHALYISRLTDLALQQITAFPEKIETLENGRVLLVRNRFGAVRIPAAGGLPVPIPGFPSFAAGGVPLGRLEELAASPDGRWILYVEPVSAAWGNLILLETASGVKWTVSEKIEKPAREMPARWSPDSRLFVYARGGQLFYFPMIHDLSAVADERYRRIGEGGIGAVSWSQQGDFLYFRGNTLYRLRGAELFTRTIYSDFLSIGTAAGVLPLEFDSRFDAFWVAPDARSVLLSKSGKTIFYFSLGENYGGDSIFPHVMILGGAVDLNVLWSSSGIITAVAPVPARNETMAWRFEIDGGSVTSFVPLQTPAASQCALSPDGTKALFWGEGGLVLWDYMNWRPLQTVSTEPVYSCAWINSGEFVAGNGRVIEGIGLSGQRRIICLSEAAEYGFEEGSERVLAKNSGQWFATDGRNPWAESSGPRLRKASQVSGRYRVYLEQQASGPYENIPMIRNIASVGTAALLPAARSAQTGRRGGGREAALCFDIYDDDTGLFRVIDALRRFGIKATFFLNGDFIRRNPAAAAVIAESGHEAASLFYAPIDLADSRYRVTPEYIARGLARNEDEYYEATGKELGLLWHPPFYRSSAEISAAASAAGYLTAVRDIDCGDWLSRDEARKLGIRQLSASEMIEKIMSAKRPGAVIPVRLGLLPGGRDDYLFLHIEVLLDALIREGYSIVPVSRAAVPAE
jgi:peptidoglycan/xylan/chitin deacetylase (PgdA/CDA1 family)